MYAYYVDKNAVEEPIIGTTGCPWPVALCFLTVAILAVGWCLRLRGEIRRLTEQKSTWTRGKGKGKGGAQSQVREHAATSASTESQPESLEPPRRTVRTTIKAHRTVATQGPVTYRLDYAQPRFVVCHGWGAEVIHERQTEHDSMD